jgi:glyoxylase-like metal-dependent hydrolase (beta-lactamase superfamily II)
MSGSRAIVDQWLSSLEIIRPLDVDTLIPGHGPITDLST